MKKTKKTISIVVPCYNEEKMIPLFYDAIKEEEKNMDYVNFEYIFVNDGSKDNTLKELKKIAKKDKSVHYISFSRNFGKEAAMYAGLSYSKGDYVTIMDADLQDPPSLLPEMYEGIVNDDYDCVGTRRVTRKGEPKIRSFFARQFYKIINKLSDIEMVDGARDYRLMTRQMVNSILDLKEYNRYTKGLWSFFGLLTYALEGIVAFSTKPLIIAAIMGLMFFVISFVMIFVIIIKTLLLGDPVSGWPSTICIIFFVSGVQLFCLGIFGMYLSKTYLETKHRPIYIVKETDLDK